MFYDSILKNLRQQTSSVILFHSGTGKDSIALCDLTSKYFDQVVCVFMYIVPDLDYENRYINWATEKYKNITFYKTPHFCLNSFIKVGYLGIKKNPSIEKMTISKIDQRVKLKFGLNWSVYGFKKNDGITRRFMLNDCPDGLHHKSQKAYPLMDLKNSDVLNYISDNNLIQPFNYNSKKPSSGCDISQPEFLDYIRKKYPSDLQKIYTVFPFCEAILFKYDNYGKEN